MLGIVDGMDRAKYALPRWHNLRTPKGADKRQRPSLDVYAVILHGRSVNVFITDENQTTGANWAMEIWTRAVQKEWHKSQQTASLFRDTASYLETTHLVNYATPVSARCFQP